MGGELGLPREQEAADLRRDRTYKGIRFLMEYGTTTVKRKQRYKEDSDSVVQLGTRAGPFVQAQLELGLKKTKEKHGAQPAYLWCREVISVPG